MYYWQCRSQSVTEAIDATHKYKSLQGSKVLEKTNTVDYIINKYYVRE